MRPRASASLGILLATTVACVSATRAQPVDFFDLGVVNAPATPASTRQALALSSFGLFDFRNGDLLTVKWIRFEVQTPIVPPLYLDVDTQFFPLNNVNSAFGLTLALYDAAGRLVAVDDRDGATLPFSLGRPAAGLSFGSTDFRMPPEYVLSRGQDGTLAAGTYWLALAAGSQQFTTAEPTGWNITTDTSYLLDFSDPDTFYLDIAMAVGNTTPLPPPRNDRCQDAWVVGENPDAFTPAWTGSNAGALNDAQFPCAGNTTPPSNIKDVWFSYVPSRTGYASIYVGANDLRSPVLMDRYDAAQGCGAPSVECANGGIYSFADGVRMFVPVTQGNPVLFAVGVADGNVLGLHLSIELAPLPCPLSTPAGAAVERETACGEDLNGGCATPARTFDPIELGFPVRGTLFSTPSLRDADWFMFSVEEASTATITYESQVPLSILAYSMPEFIASRACGGTGEGDFYPVVDVQEPSYSVICRDRTTIVDLPPGTYVMGVEPTFFDNLPCGTGHEGYWFRVDTQSLPNACSPCRADFNQDGGVDGADIESFFVEWQVGGICGDVNADGGVDGGDVETVLRVWQAGDC
jgi:hypothetical protein